MNRSVGVERTYFISDFNTIKIVDYLNEIPEELLNNEFFINKIRLIQFLDCEILFKKYLHLKGNVDRIDPIEAINELETLKSNAMEEIKSLIINKE